MAKEKKTITTKTIRITILGCLFLGLISMLVGLSIYGGNLLREYVKVSFNMARFASYVAQRGMDASELADEIMGVYNSLTEEQRSKVGTPEYREYFADLKSTKNDEYRALVSMLGVLRGMDDVEDVYLALYVDGEDKLVYFADPDSKYVMEPGDWEYVNRGESAKFNSWDGEGMLYDVSSTERYG